MLAKALHAALLLIVEALGQDIIELVGGMDPVEGFDVFELVRLNEAVDSVLSRVIQQSLERLPLLLNVHPLYRLNHPNALEPIDLYYLDID